MAGTILTGWVLVTLFCVSDKKVGVARSEYSCLAAQGLVTQFWQRQWKYSFYEQKDRCSWVNTGFKTVTVPDLLVILCISLAMLEVF